MSDDRMLLHGDPPEYWIPVSVFHEVQQRLAAAEAERDKLRKHLEETTDVVICEFADETTDQQHNTGWWVCGACWNARAKESAS